MESSPFGRRSPQIKLTLRSCLEVAPRLPNLWSPLEPQPPPSPATISGFSDRRAVNMLPRRDPSTALQAQRAQDKEAKRARGALSCAECRRLKLKCDKTVPCSSCKRRGCSAICPNGSLTTGQGTRFVLADTEKLHQKIAAMSDRIRQLEDALAILQSTQTNEPHPLLQRDQLKIKSIIELHAAGETEDGLPQLKEEEPEESQTIDLFGTLAIRDDGAATFYGRSAGQESLLLGESSSPPPTDSNMQMHGAETNWNPKADLPTNITTLASSFPFPPFTSLPPDFDFNTLINQYLPSRDEGRRLCRLYLEQSPWFFGAVTRRQLEEEIFPTWYPDTPRPLESLQALSRTSHDLALFFIVLTFGAMTDGDAPVSVAETFYTLAKASLSLAPVLERPPSVATVQTLSLMGIYEGMNGGENSIEATWGLMGLATKLAQSIGLHRDCARWNLTPAEVQKRRALFWELFITDCWQSLATGRLATFSLPFVDCELPLDPDQTMTDNGSIQPSFPFWKARFGAECVADVVQGTLTSRAPKYSIILELDRKVRDMELPAYAQGAPPQGAGLAQTMSHFMPINYRELTLLYIHRCFFAHAITSHPMDPIKSQYAPSFLAGYRSACTIIGSVRQQFELFPTQISRFWVLWTHAFSAAVMLSSVVTHSYQSKVAPAALLELTTACNLFKHASSHGGRAAKFLPILQRLHNKAQQTIFDTHNGIPPSIPGDIFRPTPPGGEPNDELSIFGGKTHTVAAKFNPAPRARPNTATASSSSTSSESPRSVIDSPPGQVFIPVDNPSFKGVHQSLVNELRKFDGHIAAQIKNGYASNSGVPAARQEVGQQDESPRRKMQREQVQREEMERQRREMEQRRLYQQQQEEEEQQRQLQEQQQQLELERQQQQHRQQQQQYQQPHPQVLPQRAQAQQYNDYEYPPPVGHQTITDQHRVVSHSRSGSDQRQAHSQQERVGQPMQQQHSMYPVPPEYRPAQPPQSQPQSQFVSDPSHYVDNEQPVYSNHRRSVHGQAHRPTEYHQRRELPPQVLQHHYATIQYNQQSRQETYQSWASPTDTAAYGSAIDQPTQAHAYATQYHYTPDGAMRGFAAEDTSLQETWQSYMNKVGSPRHLFED